MTQRRQLGVIAVLMLGILVVHDDSSSVEARRDLMRGIMCGKTVQRNVCMEKRNWKLGGGQEGIVRKTETREQIVYHLVAVLQVHRRSANLDPAPSSPIEGFPSDCEDSVAPFD